MTPQNIQTNLHTPKNYSSENHKNYEIQNFERKKMSRAYVCMKVSKNPLGAALFFEVSYPWLMES